MAKINHTPTVLYSLDYTDSEFESEYSIGMFSTLELLEQALAIHKANHLNHDPDHYRSRGAKYSHSTVMLDQMPVARTANASSLDVAIAIAEQTARELS
jgi:hypothetical protein